MRGNHHDAWVNGAEDPISGLVALLEEARALGLLLKQGWRPKRTIVYCAWDGEEPMLLGSTEWVEEHADELRQKAVVYLNTDGNGRGLPGHGRLAHARATSSTTWRATCRTRRRDVGVEARAREALADASLAGRAEADPRSGRTCASDALGSGSDFTAFLEHLGVASLNLGFGGEDDGGIYHSIYDDFYWYTHFSDTTSSTAGRWPRRSASKTNRNEAGSNKTFHHHHPQQKNFRF